jgi:hypothetical protein
VIPQVPHVTTTAKHPINHCYVTVKNPLNEETAPEQNIELQEEQSSPRLMIIQSMEKNRNQQG